MRRAFDLLVYCGTIAVVVVGYLAVIYYAGIMAAIEPTP
jgi:hypothetical protein